MALENYKKIIDTLKSIPDTSQVRINAIESKMRECQSKLNPQ